jgi:hypothetical protein
MKEIRIDEHVQLIQDLPELGLHRGQIGRVCSTWFGPATAYEVEFHPEMQGCSIRALVMLKQIMERPGFSASDQMDIPG